VFSNILRRSKPRYGYPAAIVLGGTAALIGVGTNNYNNNNVNYNTGQTEIIQTMQQRLSNEARAAEYVTKQCVIQGIPGCTVAVVKDGRLIWSYCYGFSDVANNQLLTPYSVMRIASISKPLTATAIALLVQRAQLSVDENLFDLFERLQNDRAKKIRNTLKKKYPKFYEETCKKIKVLHLCNHTSGIRHYESREEYVNNTKFASLMGVLRLFGDDELKFQPGTKYYYSSYGYILLGLVIEAVANVKYTDFMNDELIKPLNMSHTFIESDNQRIIPNQSRQYIRKALSGPKQSDLIVEEEDGSKKVYEVARGGERRPKYKDSKLRRLLYAPYSDSTNCLSSGAFLSCAVDVARFGDKVVLGRFLSNNVKKLIFETNLILTPKEEDTLEQDNEVENDDIEDFGYKDIEYGLGWHVYRRVLDPLTFTVEEICHGGGANGGCAHLLILPQHNLSIAVLMNLQQAKPTISRDIAQYFTGAD